MAIIESAIGKVQPPQQAQQRVYTVDDPTLQERIYDSRSEDEKFFQQANQECPIEEVFEKKVKIQQESITERRKSKFYVSR